MIDADDHREREALEHFAAEQEQRQHAPRNAVPAVMTVRPSVWLRLVLITSFSGSRRMPRRFSRTRSKMTIVSFVE